MLELSIIHYHGEVEEKTMSNNVQWKSKKRITDDAKESDCECTTVHEKKRKHGGD